MEEKTLIIEDLCAGFRTARGEIRAADHVSLEVPKGKITGLVGESGCGKSVTARAVMNLIRFPGRVTGGRILLEGRDLAQMKKKERRMLQGREISMIFQDPMTSLNPVMKVGKQIEESIRLHEHVSRAAAKKKTLEMLEAAGVPDPERRYECYPHQLSGGLRQRVMIAMAMVCRPKLLIADEPTTALDVTIQAQILKLMNELKEEHGTSILFITHDLGVIAQMADDVAVMYCGQVVEKAPAKTIFTISEYSHPYTEGLMVSIPRLDTPANERLDAIPGAVPHPLDLPKGCKFAPRCKYCTERCMEEEPELKEVLPGQQVRCFYPRKEERHANNR